MTAIIIFWFSVAAVFHSYVLFPVLLRIIHRWHRDPQYPPLHSPPKKISILIAAYNEEEIIITKLQSILDSDYPSASYEILIGSDASTDQTNLLVTQFDSQHPGVIRFYPFKTRRGKPNIMNHLATEATGEILVLTDANVLFDPYTLTELIRPFSNSKIGLVDTQMNNLGMKKEGISYQEKAYISREVRIKYLEGSLWGTMMGPFGGCYAIRRQLFEPIPPTYLVDDFFLNMCVLDKGFFAVNNPAARVYEDVSNDLSIEYRRKIRIATGNFQNLSHFAHLLWPPWKGRSFCFMSHKVIRWFGPFLLLSALIPLGVLSFHSALYFWLLLGYLFIFLLPLADILFKSVNLHIPLLRFLTHFMAMNLAMGVGFIKFLKGVKSNVWQPTKRHQ